MNRIKQLCVITWLYFIILNIGLCYKKHKQFRPRSCEEPNNNQSTKNPVKIKVAIAPCNTDHYTVSGTKYQDIVGCKRKLIIKIKIKSSEMKGNENKVISIREVSDFHTNRKLQLLHPLVIKIKQHDVFELYPLDPKQNINGLVTEEVLNNEDKDYIGCETNTANPTCGYTYIEDSIIPFSEGFCCSCDPKVNKARQPCEINLADSQHWSNNNGELEPVCNPNERKSRNIQDNKTNQEYYDDKITHQDDDDRHDNDDEDRDDDDDIVDDLEIEAITEDLTNVTRNNIMLPDVKIHFRRNLNDTLKKTSAHNVINITLNKDRLKRQHNKENRQIRGLQKCGKCNVPKGLDQKTYFESAHCLRFSDLWYTAFKMGKPFIDDELSIKVYAKHAPTGPRAGYCWEDLTKHLIIIGSLHQHIHDGNHTLSACYKMVGTPSFSLNNIPSYILIPQPLPQELERKYPQASGDPREYLIIEEDEISLTGSECDKSGVGFEAFVRQPGRCNHKRQTCLKNQPIHFWQKDMKARKTGEKGHYFLDNFGKVVGQQPIFANRSSGDKLLKLLYRHNYTRVIEVHVKADHITVLKSGSFGQISQVYTNALVYNSTQITAIVMNLDITAATFKIKLVNCSNELPFADYISNNDMIPPQHSNTFTLNISGVSTTTHCELQVLNIDKVVVASRRIVLEKTQRCICAWHCQCVCDDHDHLPCKPLSLDEYKRAGYLGHLPTPVYKGFPLHVAFMQCFLCVIMMMLISGIMKAIVGLCFPYIATWGLWLLCPNRARRLRRYYESRFFHDKVHYDAEGFPLHPEKFNRNVKFMPWYSEFLMNCIFFIWALKSMFIYKISRRKCYETLSSSESEHLISGRYVERCCTHSQGERYPHSHSHSFSRATSGDFEDNRPEERKRHRRRLNGSQEYLAEKFVGELIEAYFVYRNLNRPIGGVNFIPGTPYSIRGFFLRNESGKYEFNPPSPFKQYWMMDRTPIKPPLELNPNPFHMIYNTAEDVLLANDVTMNPRGVVINMR